MVQNEETRYIARILDGETEYFSVLLDRYSRPLYSLIVQIVGCSEDAEELVQDVFLKAFRNLSNYKGECLFSTWIYRIAYNTAISATRKKKQEFFYVDENTINNVPDDKADDILCLTDDEERIAKLIHAIDRLTAEEKAISEILKLSSGNVKVKLHRTRKKIYLLMNEENRYGNKNR